MSGLAPSKEGSRLHALHTWTKRKQFPYTDFKQHAWEILRVIKRVPPFLKTESYFAYMFIRKGYTAFSMMYH